MVSKLAVLDMLQDRQERQGVGPNARFSNNVLRLSREKSASGAVLILKSASELAERGASAARHNQKQE